MRHSIDDCEFKLDLPVDQLQIFIYIYDNETHIISVLLVSGVTTTDKICGLHDVFLLDDISYRRKLIAAGGQLFISNFLVI